MIKIGNSKGISVLKVIGMIIGVAVVAFFIWIMSLPEGGGGVKLANEMDEYALEYIDKHGLMNDSEQLIAYYDATISLNSSECAILTTERVIYHKNKKTSSMKLDDIMDIRHQYDKFVGDIIEIKNRNGVPFKIEVAPFNQGESFLNALTDAWERNKNENP